VKNIVLKKDIVIPAGTVFTRAPRKTERYENGHFEAGIGLSADSSGSVVYCIDDMGEEFKEWFE